jgi:hypothetical protein
MGNFKILIISSLVLFLGVLLLSINITTKLNSYKADKESIAEVLNFESRLLDGSELFSFLGSEEQKMSDWTDLKDKANAKYWSAIGDGIGLVTLVLIFMVLNYMYYQSAPNLNQILGVVFVLASLSFLYLGLQTPFIEVEAYNDDLSVGVSFISKTFEGRTYYLYQNKSIFELIKLLFLGGNIIVGFCILVLSVIFPLVKLMSSLVIFINPNTNFAQKALKTLNAIGKWSMADVFISAVFLSVFSFANMNVGVQTSSNTLIGLYFFLIFVILSIVSGKFLKMAVNPIAHEKTI